MGADDTSYETATTQKHYLTRRKARSEIATMMDNAVRGKRKSTNKPTR